jgi:hypothetical protein
MKKFGIKVALVALLVGVAGLSTPSRAETGQVAVVFTKGGFIVGVGGGEGVLTFRGKRYPLTVSGMSVGFTIGASTTKLVGRALNLNSPASIEGTFSAIGAGGAIAAGAGGVQLQNANGVILQLSGPKVGAEVSGRAAPRPDLLSTVRQRKSSRCKRRRAGRMKRVLIKREMSAFEGWSQPVDATLYLKGELECALMGRGSMSSTDASGVTR